QSRPADTSSERSGGLRRSARLARRLRRRRDGPGRRVAALPPMAPGRRKGGLSGAGLACRCALPYRAGRHPETQGTPMAVERTLSIIKPDATRRNLTGRINAKFEEQGLRIVAQKRIRLSREQ